MKELKNIGLVIFGSIVSVSLFLFFDFLGFSLDDTPIFVGTGLVCAYLGLLSSWLLNNYINEFPGRKYD